MLVAVAAGAAFTDTVVVYLVVHPGCAVPFVTVSEYMLVVVGVAVVVVPDVEPLILGPLHAYVVVLPLPLAFSVTVPPLHIYPLFDGAAVGVEFTVTFVVYTVAGLQPGLPLPSDTVNEYTKVDVGVAVVFCVIFENRPGPLQLNDVVLTPGFADKFTVPPLHIGPLLLGAADGTGLIVTDVLPSVPQQPLAFCALK